MKINSAGLEHYQSYVKAVKSGEGPGAKTKPVPAVPQNTDVVSISQDAAVRAEVGRIAYGVTAEAEGAFGEKIAALRTAVQNGSYAVSATSVADAILDRIV